MTETPSLHHSRLALILIAVGVVVSTQLASVVVFLAFM